MSADAKLKSYIDRILRCREAEDLAKNDTKVVYAELAGDGYEKAIVGQVVTFLRKREKDSDKLTAQSAKFDLYLDAYDRPSHAYARARDDEDANPRLIKQVVDGMQTETGRAALLTAVDIMIEREEAEEHEASDGSPSVSPLAGSARVEESAVANSSEAASEGAAPERDAAADERDVEATGGAALVRTNSDQPLTGGDEDPRAVGVPTSNTGEGAALSALAANPGVTLEYVPPSGVKRLPFASCFPELSKADYERLEKDIAANRGQTPIIRQGDVIVDGWARYTISRTYGLSYPVQEYSGTDVLLDVIEWQRASRNFTPTQEKKIAADLAKEFPHRADEIMAAFGLVDVLEAAQ